MSIDIPECETGGWKTYFTNVNKFVASAAHYSGKRIVSCEEVTNTSEVFNVTLEKFKIVCDQSNLSGVNHSIIHGFNYSPLEAPFPGWVRYGTFLNERNLWWPYFGRMAAYKARVSVLLQETEAFADIAVMHPLADMWTKHGTQRDPFPELHYPEYQYDVWQGIHKNGCSCDYISEGIIQGSKIESGYLRYNTRRFNTLILLDVETIMPATAEALLSFVRKGGKLIFVGKEPHLSPGLINHKKNDSKVVSIMDAIKKQSGNVFTVDAPGKDIVAWFGDVQSKCGITPYMQINRPSANVSQIRHQSAGKDIFFICNSSDTDHETIRANFPQSKGTPCLWDPETGERFIYSSAQGNSLTIELPPAASKIIVFDTEATGIAAMPTPPSTTGGREVTQWTLVMEHINGTSEEATLTNPHDLSSEESNRSFAGHIYYKKTLEDLSSFNFIDLGKVAGVSEVFLDEESLGCCWYGQHRFRIPERLRRAGQHRLVIKVTTTLGNYFKSNPENKVGHGWMRGQEWQPQGILGTVKLI
jgi:hypothetical protein